MRFQNETLAGGADAMDVEYRFAFQRNIGQLLGVSEIQFSDLMLRRQKLIKEVRQ